MKHRILIIAKRSMKAEALIRYWPSDNWDLYLYTQRKKEWFPGMAEQFGDKWLALAPAKNNGFAAEAAIAKKQAIAANPLAAGRKKVRKFLHTKLIRFYDQKLLNWAIPSIKDLNSITKKVTPDLVLSIYEPLAANLIARKVSALRDIPWIVYFRDHCTTYNEMLRVPGLWHLQSAYDRRIHAPMSSLVGVSPQFVDILNRFYHLPASRCHVITGGYDDRYLPEKIKARCLQRRQRPISKRSADSSSSSRLKVNYIGMIYGHRIKPLITFLKALQMLSQKGVPIELRLVLSNASYLFPTEVRLMIEQLKRDGITLLFDDVRIAYNQALEILDSSDVNVILEGMDPPHSTAGTLTLKIFDLMMIANPGIAVCGSSLPIGDYLRETGIGTDFESVDGVVRALQEVWMWQQGGDPPAWYSPNPAAIEQYSCRAMAQKMSELSQDVLTTYAR